MNPTPLSASASPNVSGMGEQLPIQHEGGNRYSVTIGGRAMIATVNDPRLKEGKPAEIQKLLQEILSHQTITEEVSKGLDEYHINVPFTGSGEGSIKSIDEQGAATTTALKFDKTILAKLSTIYQRCMNSLNDALMSFSLIETPPPATAAAAHAPASPAASTLAGRTIAASSVLHQNVSNSSGITITVNQPTSGGSAGVRDAQTSIAARSASTAGASPGAPAAAATHTAPKTLETVAKKISKDIDEIGKDDSKPVFSALYGAWQNIQRLENEGFKGPELAALKKQLVEKTSEYKIHSKELEFVDPKTIVNTIKDGNLDSVRDSLTKLLIKASVLDDPAAKQQLLAIHKQVGRSLESLDMTFHNNWNKLFQGPLGNDFRSMWSDFISLSDSSPKAKEATAKEAISSDTQVSNIPTKAKELAGKINASLAKAKDPIEGFKALVRLRQLERELAKVPLSGQTTVELQNLRAKCLDTLAKGQKLEENESYYLGNLIGRKQLFLEKQMEDNPKSIFSILAKPVTAKTVSKLSGKSLPPDIETNFKKAKEFYKHVENLKSEYPEFAVKWNAMMEAEMNFRAIWSELGKLK
jgi:hypothetical protein